MKAANMESLVDLVATAGRLLVAFHGIRGRDGSLPGLVIVGDLPARDGGTDWASFRRNRTFIDFLARFFAGGSETAPDLGEARVRPGENFFLIDPRTADPLGRVPPEDIIGAYETDLDGCPVLRTFEYNPHHRLVTDGGRLSGLFARRDLRAALLAEAAR